MKRFSLAILFLTVSGVGSASEATQVANNCCGATCPMNHQQQEPIASTEKKEVPAVPGSRPAISFRENKR